MASYPDTKRERPSIVLPSLALAALVYAGLQGWIPGPVPEPAAQYVTLGAQILGFGLVWYLSGFVLRAFSGFQTLIASKSPSSVHGTARYANRKDIVRAGLTQEKGLWVGVYEDLVLRFQNETHTLVVASAGSGKTVDDVIMQLGIVDMPMFINDAKKELYYTTARWREQQFGHKIIVINAPDDAAHPAASYNVCDLVVEALVHEPRDALTDAWGIATQLHPDPAKPDANAFFRHGARQIVSFTIVATAILSPEECCLPLVQKIVTDTPVLLELCEAMKDHPALQGDVAAIAQSLLSTHQSTPKLFGDFQTGAVQALSGFAPSGRLAAMSTTSTFRFRDLKEQGKLSIYVLFDMTRMHQFKKLVSLLNWACMVELQRCGHPQRVMIMMDEASNFPIIELPNYLTALRGYGISVYMVFQELEEIKRVYGEAALATLLGQSDMIKAFGIKSQATAEHISKLCGTTTVETGGFGLGRSEADTASQSRGFAGRPLLTPDQIRLLEADEQLVILKNLPVLRCRRVGYHQVEPLRSGLAPNPMHGGVPYRGEKIVEL